MTKDEHYYQQQNQAYFDAHLNTDKPVTAQTINSIVSQLKAIHIAGKLVFEHVYIERPNYGRVNICAETFASTAKMLFYISEEEMGKLDIVE